MENGELSAQQKLFQATGLREGDIVKDKYSGGRGEIYVSAIGYACVKLRGGGRVIWGDNFEREEA